MGIVPISKIKASVKKVAKEYSIIKRVTLFGSYASGRQTNESDIDLLVEFNQRPICLLEIIGVEQRLGDLIQKKVDVVPSPIKKDSILEIEEEILLYG